jgi:hypothetical protein
VHLITSGSSKSSFALASDDNNISAMHTAASFLFIIISHFHTLPKHVLGILQFDTLFRPFVLSKALAPFLNSGGIHIFQRIS